MVSAALSAFRKAKLLANMQSSVATVKMSMLHSLHFVELADNQTLTVEQETVLQRVLPTVLKSSTSFMDQSVFSGSSF